MLDKSLPYYSIIMKRPGGAPIPDYPLPEGFSYVMYEPGDELPWAEIETSVKEFDHVEDALAYFKKRFMPYPDELARRCMFIEDRAGDKIATLTTWWSYTGVRRDPWLHWIALKPEYQGQGLGKALVSRGMQMMVEIEGDRDVYLSTQTWSYKAVGLYKKVGFEYTAEKGLGGYANDQYEKAVEVLEQYVR